MDSICYFKMLLNFKIRKKKKKKKREDLNDLLWTFEGL